MEKLQAENALLLRRVAGEYNEKEMLIECLHDQEYELDALRLGHKRLREALEETTDALDSLCMYPQVEYFVAKHSYREPVFRARKLLERGRKGVGHD